MTFEHVWEFGFDEERWSTSVSRVGGPVLGTAIICQQKNFMLNGLTIVPTQCSHTWLLEPSGLHLEIDPRGQNECL